MKAKSLFLLVLLSATQFGYSQTADNRFSVGLSLGKNEYKGELGNGIFNFKAEPHGFLGLTFSTYISPSFDFGIQGNYGDYGYSESSLQNMWGKKYEGTLFTHYKFNNGYILKEKSLISPFIELGVGVAGYTHGSGNDLLQNNRIDATGADLLIPIGAGLKFQLSENVAFQYKFVYNFTNNDFRDFKVSSDGGANDVFAEHSLSFIFSFGKGKDTDNDGIADKYDKCPDTPAGVKVTSSGCPIDSDNDGVADYLDKCPTVAGLAKFDGCPDTDNDGIQDSEDKCPTVAGIAKFNGCPDTDNDGIQDSEDKCPSVAGLPQFSGCPDSDNDGVQDSEDKCPNTPAGVKVDASGCPLDRDGDGVADYLDKCPDVPGLASNKGCPEVKAEVKKVFDQALQGIQFESGKDVIKKTSFGILDQVVKVLKDNPAFNIEINGHTDSKGAAAKNLVLSQKRSDAVKAYLVSKSIAAERLAAKGFGQTMPVADNATAAGMAKNRRVEFKVNF